MGNCEVYGARQQLSTGFSNANLSAVITSRNEQISISNLLTNDFFRSGDDRARTGNPQLAKLVLSQLSYVPVPIRGRHAPSLRHATQASSRRSVTAKGMLQCAHMDSNHGPRRYQRRALTN